jgi:hypothetical protein
MKKLGKKVRGASLVEYALLCAAVVVATGVAVRSVGKQVEKNAGDTVNVLGIR